MASEVCTESNCMEIFNTTSVALKLVTISFKLDYKFNLCPIPDLIPKPATVFVSCVLIIGVFTPYQLNRA
jgi:hypothetical protein